MIQNIIDMIGVILGLIGTVILSRKEINSNKELAVFFFYLISDFFLIAYIYFINYSIWFLFLYIGYISLNLKGIYSNLKKRKRSKKIT